MKKLFFIVLALGAGCKPPPPETTPEAPPPNTAHILYRGPANPNEPIWQSPSKAWPKSPDTSDRTLAIPDLTMIMIAYENFKHVNSRPPRTKQDLEKIFGTNQRLNQAVEDGTYVVHLNDDLANPNKIIAYYYLAPRDGGHVLFANRQVKLLTSTDFAQAIKGQSP